jgi:hypothetical protein
MIIALTLFPVRLTTLYYITVAAASSFLTIRPQRPEEETSRRVRTQKNRYIYNIDKSSVHLNRSPSHPGPKYGKVGTFPENQLQI